MHQMIFLAIKVNWKVLLKDPGRGDCDAALAAHLNQCFSPFMLHAQCSMKRGRGDSDKGSFSSLWLPRP